MPDQNKTIILILALVAIAAGVFFLESRKASPDTADEVHEIDIDDTLISTGEHNVARIALKEEQFTRAREITTPDGFVNVDSITISEHIGKNVILVDFWTYSCINCQRTLPYLNSWNEKYEDKGLVILGLHTPEFEFEKDYDNVTRAVEKYGVKYPVILDNDFSTWRAYENRYWPRKYLIDIDGFIVYDHIGEGAYDETEEKIVELLNERSEVLGDAAVAIDTSEPSNTQSVDFTQVRTPETYLGSARIEHIANLPSLDCLNKSCSYFSPGTPVLNTFELRGTWNIAREAAVLESETGSIFIRFSASKVNIVAESLTGETIHGHIYLDGELVRSGAGSDVSGGELNIGDSDLYNLIDLDGEYGEHLLEIRFENPGVEAFAFTFG